MTETEVDEIVEGLQEATGPEVTVGSRRPGHRWKIILRHEEETDLTLYGEEARTVLRLLNMEEVLDLLERHYRMLNLLADKIDWSHSFLDAHAIREWNESHSEVARFLHEHDRLNDEPNNKDS